MQVRSQPAMTYQQFTIRVPKSESKRFRAIVKAFNFDFDVTELSPMDRSLMEERMGMVQTYDSLDELVKEIG